MPPLPLLHIGLPKTASTTLQNVFAKHPGVANLGRPYTDSANARLALAVRFHDTLTFDPSGARALFEQGVRGSLEGPRVPVFSDEGFSAAPDRGLTADRLRDLFGPCNVLLVLRQPHSLLESMYLQHLRGTGDRWAYVPFTKWLSEAQQSWDNARQGPFLRLAFFDLAEAYAARFGREHVKVVLFEDLVESPAAFAREVCTFAGLDPEAGTRLIRGRHDNERLTRRDIQYLRAAPWLRGAVRKLPAPVRERLRRGLNKGNKAEAAMPPEWRTRVAELCVEQDQRIAKVYQVPLDEHGYPL